jgi:hypothetical protein
MKFKHLTIKTDDFVGQGANPTPTVAISPPAIGRKHIVLKEYGEENRVWAQTRHHSHVTLVPLQQIQFATNRSDSEGHLSFVAGLEFAFKLAASAAKSNLNYQRVSAYCFLAIVSARRGGRHVKTRLSSRLLVRT